MVGGAPLYSLASLVLPCLPRLPLSSPSCLPPPRASWLPRGSWLPRALAGTLACPPPVHVSFAVCKLCKCAVEEAGGSVRLGRLGRPASVEPRVCASVGRSCNCLGTHLNCLGAHLPHHCLARDTHHGVGRGTDRHLRRITVYPQSHPFAASHRRPAGK